MSSVLNKLRGGNSAPVKLFADDMDTGVKAVFERLMSDKPKTSKFNNNDKKTFVPSRFRVAKGETKQLVIIDEKFSFAMDEHSLQGVDGKWTTERCIQAYDSCPLCTHDGASLASPAFLTVLDLTPWTKTDKNGVKTEVPYTKRVIAIKRNDFASFSGLLQVHGSFRGLVLNMTRGTGDKESAIGKPTYVTKLTEDELVEGFGSEQVLSEKGNVIRPANDALIPYDYERHFAPLTSAEIRAKYRLPARFGSDDFGTEDDSPPFDLSNSLELLDLSEIVPHTTEEADQTAPLDLSADLPEAF